MANKKNEQGLFIKIDHPVEFRRDLLESSRDTIKLLQSIDKINKIRIEKVEETFKLNRQLRELKKLMLYLKSQLPKSDPVIVSEVASSRKIKSLDSQKPTKPLNKKSDKILKRNFELDDDVKKLDDQLSLIEKKINELS